MSEYDNFIKIQKLKRTSEKGFEAKNLNKSLFPFQKFIVEKSLKMGRYAIFADCGLGKTIMQLEWANQVSDHTNKPVLILAPLAVSSQTIEEGLKFGIKVGRLGSGNIQISNYEQLDNIDCSQFSGIVLDESSILKNFTGKLRNKIIDSFKDTPFKLACTATPSPNDPMELGNHAEFLNVMSRNEMLSMYFVHDGGNTSKWRLKGHAIDSFYQFVGSWSIMLNRPADIGFPMKGFDLPKLNILEEEIETPKRDNGQLFNDAIVSATNFNQELRDTMGKRLNRTSAIVNDSDENFIVWVKQNQESEAICKMIPDAVEVTGSDSPEEKERSFWGLLIMSFGCW